MKELTENVVDSLSRLILISLQGASTQQYFPSSNPDDMDERIKEGKARAVILRKLREDFENIVTGIL